MPNSFDKSNLIDSKGDCQVFYRDFWGKRNDKLKEVLETQLPQNFAQIDWQKFNQEFRKTRWGKKENLLEEQTGLQSKSNKKAKKSDDKKAGKTKRTGFVDDLSFFTPIEEYGEAWEFMKFLISLTAAYRSEKISFWFNSKKKKLNK